MIKRIAGLVVGFAISTYGSPGLPQSAAEELADGRTQAPYIEPGTRNSNPAEGKLKGQVLRIKRPLLLVTDLQRSVAFYRDVIGLEVYNVETRYSNDPDGMGNKLLNLPPGTRWRVATLNTSDEARGITLREVPDVDFAVSQDPRKQIILFEASDALGVYRRALTAGVEVFPPAFGGTTASNGMRLLEFGLLDPDGYVLAFFKYVDSAVEWEQLQRDFRAAHESGPGAALERLLAMLEGTYVGGDSDEPMTDTRFRIDAPKLGQHVYYGELRPATSDEPYRQNINILTAEGDVVRQRTMQLKNGSEWPPNVTSASFQDFALENLVDSLPEGCSTAWRQTENGWRGYMDPNRCSVYSERLNVWRNIEAETFLSAEEIKHAERGFDENGKQLFGTAPGEHYSFERMP